MEPGSLRGLVKDNRGAHFSVLSCDLNLILFQISLRGGGEEGVLDLTASKFKGTLRYMRRADTSTCGASWACQRRSDKLGNSPPGGAGLSAEAADAPRGKIGSRSVPWGPTTDRPTPPGWALSACSAPLPSSALHPASEPGRRRSERGGPRRHGARAAGRLRARGAGASPAWRARRGPEGLGLSAERGRGPAPALRTGRGGRAACGGAGGEDGRPHPEAVLPHPGEAAHQLHPAGPGEVMRRQARPAVPPGPPLPALRPARSGRPGAPAPAAALAPLPLSADGGPTPTARHGGDGQLWPFDAGQELGLPRGALSVAKPSSWWAEARLVVKPD